MKSKVTYGVIVVVVAAATIAVMLLMQNIFTRKREAEQVVFKVVDIDENTIDPAIWGKNFPRQYDGYLRTADATRTRFGGSEAEPRSKIDDDPRWKTLFQGYAFSVDYRERRGHAYMLVDQHNTERVKQFKQPGTCLHCHASVIPAYREAGKKAGVPDAGPADPFNWAQVMKGFETINPKPYAEVAALVDHPVACVDCHDAHSMKLRVTRPGFVNGIRALAQSSDPVAHLPSIARWRSGDRKAPYDPNVDATRQEMRSFVCGQCHVEYYFRGTEKLLVYPWHNGLKVQEMEQYYDDAAGHGGAAYKDWVHPRTGAPILKAQHPEFETWSQGIHARSGVSCADCHMPYMREGAIKISDHHVQSPLLNISRACQTCHRYPEAEIMARVEAIQDRTHGLLIRSEEAVMALIDSLETAGKGGATDDQLKAARFLHRQAQWRLDFVAAENSMGFHAPQETARILAESIDYARQGQVEVLKSASGKSVAQVSPD